MHNVLADSKDSISDILNATMTTTDALKQICGYMEQLEQEMD